MQHNLSTLIYLDDDKKQSLVRQLTDRLRTLITSRQVTPGYRFPSSRELARSLGVSRNTVTYAVDQLRAEGYLDVQRGRRPVVAKGLRPLAALADRGSPSKAVDASGLSVWAKGLPLANWPSREFAVQPLLPTYADVREFPHDAWARCLRRSARYLGRMPESGLNRASLRTALLQHLSQNRGVRADEDQIFLLPTAQAALTLLAAIAIDAGDIAWIESPGYGGAYGALQAVGARIEGIPLDEEGLNFAGCESRPKLIFATPSHQFPTGSLMSVKRRLDLLEFAAASHALIIEDDYDGDFHYDERPVPALQGLDRTGRVFYLGTFSKTMYSDIRLGYAVVPRNFVDIFAMAQRHMGLLAPIHLQEALAEFVAEGSYLTHVRKMTRLYRTRRDHLIRRLRDGIGAYLSIQPPAGGMQLAAWARFPLDDEALVAALAQEGVAARPLSDMFYGVDKRSGLFLGFAGWRETEIDQACRVIGDLVRRHAAGRPVGE